METNEILGEQTMKKILNVTVGIAVYSLCALLFFGYGHTETHVPLNTSITLRFLELISTKSTIDKVKFKNYEFNWNNGKQPILVGPALTKDYYTSYSESDEEDLGNSPVDWISKGGWMEDEPWGPASICHFYDPLGIDNGKKYLTDQSGKLEWVASIPKEWLSRDAKTWATSYSENKYGWRKAKENVVKALKESNPELKKNYMAKAYRCLGQTLHLVADMGCPPHVRNDSHPPKVSFLVGDPDPYEDICKKLDTYTLVKATAPNPTLMSGFEKTEKFEEIFENLARFTNERFYSGGTINTNRYKPKIRSNNPYPSPLMADAEYNKSEYTYYKTYEGNVTVKMCKDKVPIPFQIFGNDSTRGRPYLDYECVESMASAIMPNVVEAGANVIRLFVPSLKININTAKLDSGGIIRGKVVYTIPSADDEYSGLFDLTDLYNGPVNLVINGSDTKVSVIAKKNNFEFKLDGKVKDLKLDDLAVVNLDLGGIVIKSDSKPLTVASIQPKQMTGFLNNLSVTYVDQDKKNSTKSESFGFVPSEVPTAQIGLITWNGNTFSYNITIPKDATNSYDRTYAITGTLSGDQKTLLTFSYKRNDVAKSQGTETNSTWTREVHRDREFTIENVPKDDYIVPNTIRFRITGTSFNSYKSKFSYTETWLTIDKYTNGTTGTESLTQNTVSSKAITATEFELLLK